MPEKKRRNMMQALYHLSRKKNIELIDDGYGYQICIRRGQQVVGFFLSPGDLVYRNGRQHLAYMLMRSRAELAFRIDQKENGER